MDTHENDPLLAEAIARRDESRAQILRSRANTAGGNSTDRLASAFEKLAGQAEKAQRQSAEALTDIKWHEPDPEGTSRSLADSEGNFPANAEVASTGGIGIDASNTDVPGGQTAKTAEEAGKAVTEGAQKIVGDQRVEGNLAGGEAANRAGVEIPAGWKDLSWQERRSLASKLSEQPISNGEEANAAIESELKRRG